MRVTQHRYHAGNNFERFIRIGDNPNGDRIYQYTACPGVDNPVIDTLLSIPFSLIHTLPRLAGLVPPTIHRQQLITMGYEIMRLWWWDSPRDMIKDQRQLSQQQKKKSATPTYTSH